MGISMCWCLLVVSLLKLTQYQVFLSWLQAELGSTLLS